MHTGGRQQGGGGITRAQREAIEEAMRIIVEDDRQRGVDPGALAPCDRCRTARPLLGAVTYDGVRLCNACATGYEVARLTGEARSCADFAAAAVGAAP